MFFLSHYYKKKNKSNGLFNTDDSGKVNDIHI